MHRRGCLMDDPYIDNTTERRMDDQARKALELARLALENFWLKSPSMQDKLTEASKAISAIDAALASPAAPVAQPLAGLISRASMVLKPSAGHEVTFRFDDLEDATRMRLWAESRVAQVAAPWPAPASQPVSEPVKAQPLTDERAAEMLGFVKGGLSLDEFNQYNRDRIRLVQKGWNAAHGIGQSAAPAAPVAREPLRDQCDQILNGLGAAVTTSNREYLRVWLRDWFAHGIGQGGAA